MGGVSLVVCTDLSPARWIVRSELPWERLVRFGPAGFAAYARVRFIPDPERAGQQESDADADASPGEIEQWRVLLELLAARTAHPEDCYFALWEGWPLSRSARSWPTFAVPDSASIPARRFFLFHGSVEDVKEWGTPATAGIWSAPEFAQGGTPAFVWPADRTWCVAADVDPHWAGIGASQTTIDLLIADPRLDAVVADPDAEQPAYR